MAIPLQGWCSETVRMLLEGNDLCMHKEESAQHSNGKGPHSWYEHVNVSSCFLNEAEDWNHLF